MLKILYIFLNIFLLKLFSFVIFLYIHTYIYVSALTFQVISLACCTQRCLITLNLSAVFIFPVKVLLLYV